MFIKSLLGAALFALTTATAWAGVEINKADQAMLESVKGIGPGLSTKLLEERKRGAYKSWDDLIDRVPGVGAGSAARLSGAGLTVNDTPYAGAAATPKAKTVSAPATGKAGKTDPAAK